MSSISYIQTNRRFRIILCLTLSLAGFIFNCIAYYPGFMSPDGFDQYTQALTSNYHDWHPTVMAALWHILLIFHKGQEPMLFLQLLLLWSSFFFLISFFTRYYFKTFFLVILFVFSPFVQNYAGVIYKDVEMALSWLFAISLMLEAFYEKRHLGKGEIIFVFLALTYGCWLRFNAFPGAIPLILVLIYLSGKHREILKWHILLSKTILIIVVITLAQMAFNRLIIKPQRVFPENKIYMHDLTGIYSVTGKNYFPHFIKSYPGFDGLYLKEHYNNATFDHIWWNPDGKDLFPASILVFNADSSKTLRNAWLHAVWENKSVYLQNKYSGFLNYLRIQNRVKKYYTDFPYISENNYGIEFKPNGISKLFIKSIASQKDFIYMRPWFWALCNIVLLFGWFIKKAARVKWMNLSLNLSSLLYLLPQFFVFQIDTDLRYFYWNCVSLSLSFIILISEIIIRSGKPVIHSSSLQKEVAPERL